LSLGYYEPGFTIVLREITVTINTRNRFQRKVGALGKVESSKRASPPVQKYTTEYE